MPEQFLPNEDSLLPPETILPMTASRIALPLLGALFVFAADQV